MRIYDPRVGDFLSLDPLAATYPFYSPYLYAGNSPIRFIHTAGAGPGNAIQLFVNILLYSAKVVIQATVKQVAKPMRKIL
ncbi:hypothetical protein KW844_12860 [Chitinophaga sp. sic0106]|nr:hypothetical protein [Chitinophaga sp. sic0106]